ncbi:MAG: hypothetical protein AAF840_00955 [Bacteroidota bacterium]
MYRSLLTLLLLFLLCTCAPSPETAEAPAENPAPAANTAAAVTYPSIDLDRLVYLYKNATYMDATFYNLPISINQSALEQIQQTIATVGEDPATIKPDCSAIGHIWFQVNGKNVEEADIYFQAGCIAYVWYENGKPAYSNMMTEGGVAFYNNIFSSLQQQGGGE